MKNKKNTAGNLSSAAAGGNGAPHNRVKNYIINEGDDVPALTDAGVFTKDGKVAAPMRHKYRQINRFLELIGDVVKVLKTDKLNIVDFGCGKSYLTFAVYYYLERVLGLNVSVTGLDLKKDVIEKCAAAANKYGYGNLRFLTGDIKDFSPSEKPDMVISLHACDTATDYAVYNAVSWGVKALMCVPCCQKELNGQIKTDGFPLITKYGIVKERISALYTDIIRASLLESRGYKTQILEFTDTEHSLKNLMLRSVKSNLPDEIKKRSLAEAESLMKEFNLNPTLYGLLYR